VTAPEDVPAPLDPWEELLKATEMTVRGGLGKRDGADGEAEETG